jgi:hypothetical protein
MKQHLPLLSLPVLLAPLLLRFLKEHPLIPGPESYQSFTGTYGFLLSLLEPLGSWVIVISMCAGVLSAYLFHQLAKSMSRSPKTRQLLTLLFIINPVFLGVFTSLNPYTLAVPVALGLLLSKQKLLPAVLLALIAPDFAVLFLLARLIMAKHRALWPGLLLAITLTLSEINMHAAATPLVEFAVPGGLSLLLIVLACIELLLRWGEAKTHLFLFIGVIILALFSDAALVIAGFASTPWAGLLLHRLRIRKWTIKQAQPLALLLIACALLFLLISHTLLLAEQQPTSQVISLLNTLPEESTLLAPQELAPVIQRFSTSQPVLTEKTCRLNAPACDDVEVLYHARRMDVVESIMVRQGISHLLITKQMREGGVWQHDEDGLLFLMKHSGRFDVVAATDDEELWRWT